MQPSGPANPGASAGVCCALACCRWPRDPLWQLGARGAQGQGREPKGCRLQQATLYARSTIYVVVAPRAALPLPRGFVVRWSLGRSPGEAGASAGEPKSAASACEAAGLLHRIVLRTCRCWQAKRAQLEVCRSICAGALQTGALHAGGCRGAERRALRTHPQRNQPAAPPSRLLGPSCAQAASAILPCPHPPLVPSPSITAQRAIWLQHAPSASAVTPQTMRTPQLC
jgi:hypothetical protein